MACVIDIMCNTLSGIGAGFLTGGGGLFFQAYDIKSFCEMEVSNKISCRCSINICRIILIYSESGFIFELLLSKLM